MPTVVMPEIATHAGIYDRAVYLFDRHGIDPRSVAWGDWDDSRYWSGPKDAWVEWPDGFSYRELMEIYDWIDTFYRGAVSAGRRPADIGIWPGNA